MPCQRMKQTSLHRYRRSNLGKKFRGADAIVLQKHLEHELTAMPPSRCHHTGYLTWRLPGCLTGADVCLGRFPLDLHWMFSRSEPHSFAHARAVILALRYPGRRSRHVPPAQPHDTLRRAELSRRRQTATIT